MKRKKKESKTKNPSPALTDKQPNSANVSASVQIDSTDSQDENDDPTQYTVMISTTQLSSITCPREWPGMRIGSAMSLTQISTSLP